MQGIAQTTYTWNLAGNGSWATAGNWTPTRTTPATNDILVINNGGTKIITDVTTETIGRLIVGGNTSITLSSSSTARTLTISNTGTGLDIQTGSTLSLTGTNGASRTLTIIFSGSGNTNTIAGTLNITDGGNPSFINFTNSSTSVTGNLSINAATCGITSTAANLTIASGGRYTHAINGGTIPTATWNTASTCNITGITTTSPSGLTQSFGNFTWDCAGHSTLINLNSLLTTINGNFTLRNAGQFNSGNGRTQNGLALSSSTNVTLNVGGNFSIEQAGANASWFILTTGTANVTMNVGGNFNMSRVGSGPVFFDCYTGTTLNTIALNITGNYVQTGGQFDWALTNSTSANFVTMNLTGNFTHSGTSILVGSTTDGGTPNGKIIFTGSGTSTFSSATPGNIGYTNFEVATGKTLELLSNASLTSQATPVIWGGQFEVMSGATIDMNTFQIVSSSGVTAGQNNAFILNATAKVITANNNGLENTTIGSVSTSIATRTYNSGADYEFQGNATGTFTTTPTAATARDIIINNTSADVVFNQSMAVNRTFNFISGRANIGSFIVTINSTASITGNTNTRYVITVPTTATNGRLRQNGLATAARVFPVGTASNYLPVTITPVATGSDFSINVFRSTTTDGLPGGPAWGPISAPRTHQVDALYRIDQIVGTNDVQIRFDWQTNAIEGAVFTALANNQIGIWVRKANWVLAAGTGSANYVNDNTANFSRTNGNLTDFGTPGTGYPYIVANIATLPFRFTMLDVTKTNRGTAFLEWQLDIDASADYFEVEESGDGITFAKLSKIYADGSKLYRYTDLLLNEGSNYYRIRAVNKQGEIVYSSIVAINNKLTATLQLLNNPVVSQLVFKHPKAVNAGYRITDLTGRTLMSGRITPNAVITQIDMSKLTSGTYILHYTDGSEQIVNQFIRN